MLAEWEQALARVAAARYGVCPEIHPEDFVFRFLRGHRIFQRGSRNAFEHYFHDGATSARLLRQLLVKACRLKARPLSLLEFASGYGCVTRHLGRTLPLAELTACDIHPQAVRFIEQTLGHRAVLSAARPERLALDDTFDVAFALSFFSHLPKPRFGPWLDRLAALVRPGGFLVFTTHGLRSIQHLPDCRLDDEGFWFSAASEQRDLDPSEYGSAVTHPSWVTGQVHRVPGLVLTYFQEAKWWAHQDVYVARRVP